MSEELDQFEPEATAEPEVAPEPEVESEPEPEFHHEPEFLSEPDAPQYQEPQWSPQQIQAYNEQIRQQPPPPPQYQQQPQYQQPQQNTAEAVLNRLVQNPDGTMREIAGQTAQQVAQQMMQQYLGPQQARQQQFLRGQAEYQASEFGSKIDSMYKKSFNKDETFKSNDRVRARIDNTIGGMFREAKDRAMYNGDPRGFAIFNNPTFAQSVLAVAKIMEGVTPTASEMAAIPHVERTTPSAQPQSAVEIDPDTESAISKFGNSFRERYIKELENQDKYNDFQG